jgi:hypothetical protein
MEPLSREEEYNRWMDAVALCWQSGWRCVERWVFESPSGTRHDLSAADLGKLARIEREGLFLAPADDDVDDGYPMLRHNVPFDTETIGMDGRRRIDGGVMAALLWNALSRIDMGDSGPCSLADIAAEAER